MNKTKIEWADYTWNPVTGCLHGCSYCYARRVAQRFAIAPETSLTVERLFAEEFKEPTPTNIHDLQGGPVHVSGVIDHYPFEFEPTFHRYRLEEPARKDAGVTIFVCSMADLFGEWVPDSWISEIFNACKAAPQHRYLFLTKNPIRYTKLAFAGLLPQLGNFWYGYTVTDQSNAVISVATGYKSFISAEPLLGPLAGITGPDPFDLPPDWVIAGAQTGPGSKENQPKREWIDAIVANCKQFGTPIFMKESLATIMGADMLRQLPQGIRLPTKKEARP